MKQSPTSRTLAYLRKLGYACGITEHWNQYAKIRQDLFGFVDIVAVHPLGEVIFIQCTSGTNHAARREKILANPIARIIMRKNQVWVLSWAKQGPRGKRKTWTVRREVVGGNSAGERGDEK